MDSDLAQMFPNLQTLTLEYFTGEQLSTFLENLQSPSKLVKLNIKYLLEHRQNELLDLVLSVNNRRVKFIRFDQASIFLPLNITDKTIFYQNIEELIVNLIDCEMLGDLFTRIPNVRRLHINLGLSPFVSIEKLKNISPLLHLNDFKLYSIQMTWGFEEINNILCKMPSLHRITLCISTTDKRLVNKEDLAVILPLSLVQMNFFIIYNFAETSIEFDTLLNTWPRDQISMTRLPDGSNQYAAIQTIPFNIDSIVLLSILAKNMLPAWKYMRNVQNLNIHRGLSSSDILMILQHLDRIQTLKINATAAQLLQPIVLHLPYFKQLKITDSCELFPIFKAAPNLNHLSIDFGGYNRLITDELLCELLEKQLECLEICRLQGNSTIKFDLIIIKFTNLRRMILSTADSTNDISSLILQALEVWRDEEYIYICIKGTLSRYGNETLREWFNNHNCLTKKDSFAFDYHEKRAHIWL
ncbi:unnamed protein product [Adineta ricciae]|uniref:Uncharacterized protein n=1 Tax=Adineta ricciae TaxID=249248 RepID=A0A815RZW8_ADIRI|nr:unnamed protein product [Adineta ricciae]CAF1483543.1 unnamed protein product [Adineta ricciae]